MIWYGMVIPYGKNLYLVQCWWCDPLKVQFAVKRSCPYVLSNQNHHIRHGPDSIHKNLLLQNHNYLQKNVSAFNSGMDFCTREFV